MSFFILEIERRGRIALEVGEMDVWKSRVQDDISELKNNQAQIRNEQINMKSDIADLRMNDRLQDQEIKTLKEALFEIKDDTNWIRRKITGALITAAITAVVAGIIGVAVTKIYGV